MTLKLKRTPGLYLVGFMATGKSTIGRALAEELGWSFVDIDQDIETQEKTTITRIFTERGEAAFRDLEAAAIRRRVRCIESGCPCVVALGGGAFIQKRNWELIENNGVTVWLDCALEIVQGRLANDASRPLATNGDAIAKLFDDRRPLYARADFRINVDCGDVNTIVRQIMGLPIF